ncbi:MAG: DUF6134 family protein [Kiloniellaceae bacterium]
MAGGAFAAGLLPAIPGTACRLFPADGEVDFMVRRHDRVIGGHRIRFARSAGRFTVRTDVEIEVGLFGAPVFRFTHHAEEVWRDGWLQAVVSDTDDDGRPYRVRAERRDGIFGGTVNGARFTVSGYIIPSSLWHHDTIAVEALFDTIDARVKLVRAKLLGSEPVPVGGKPVTAKHYALFGEIERELWYASDCRLVRVAFLARDGSEITLEPR